MASTPSQTVGPFFEYALPYEGGERLVSSGDPDAIRIVGAVLDGDGQAVDDALVELWQANRHGRYRHPEDTREELPLEDGFAGFGRCGTEDDGRFELVTVKPGAVPWPEGGMQDPLVYHDQPHQPRRDGGVLRRESVFRAEAGGRAVLCREPAWPGPA